MDLTLSFLLVSAVGADRVREAEDWVLAKLEWRRKDGEPGKIKNAITTRVEGWKESHGGHKEHHPVPPPPPPPQAAVVAGPAPTPTGYSAIATTAVLAYAIHKTVLLPVRVGLTVAITPKVVRVLQSWGSVRPLGSRGPRAQADARVCPTLSSAIRAGGKSGSERPALRRPGRLRRRARRREVVEWVGWNCDLLAREPVRAQIAARSFSTASRNASLSIPLPLTAEFMPTIGFCTTCSENGPV